MLGGASKENLFFSYFFLLFWKMDLIIGAPAAILGLGKKGHKNCTALAMLFLGLNLCQDPPSSRLLLHENKRLCWSHCSQVSVTISQTQFLLFFPSYADATIHAVAQGRNLGAYPLYLIHPCPTIPCTHPLTMYCLFYLVISLVAASSCLALLPCHHSGTQLHLLGLLKWPFFWSLALTFTVLLPEWSQMHIISISCFKSFSDSSWPIAVPFKHF